MQDMFEGQIQSVRKKSNFPKGVKSVDIQEQVVYKLRHKQTGLYYAPQGYLGNVSEIGKVYSKKPARQSFIHIPRGVEFSSGFDINTLPKARHQDCYKTELDDWEVISYTLTEIKE